MLAKWTRAISTGALLLLAVLVIAVCSSPSQPERFAEMEPALTETVTPDQGPGGEPATEEREGGFRDPEPMATAEPTATPAPTATLSSCAVGMRIARGSGCLMPWPNGRFEVDEGGQGHFFRDFTARKRPYSDDSVIEATSEVMGGGGYVVMDLRAHAELDGTWTIDAVNAIALLESSFYPEILFVDPTPTTTPIPAPSLEHCTAGLKVSRESGCLLPDMTLVDVSDPDDVVHVHLNYEGYRFEVDSAGQGQYYARTWPRPDDPFRRYLRFVRAQSIHLFLAFDVHHRESQGVRNEYLVTILRAHPGLNGAWTVDAVWEGMGSELSLRAGHDSPEGVRTIQFGY